MKCPLLFYLFIVIVTCDDFENFYEYVENRMDDINAHVRATNNSYMSATRNSIVHSGGSYNFIIVGGGSAGTVLASRLSEIKRWKILLLEAGGPRDNFTDVPGFSPFLQVSDMDWGYLTTPQKNSCQGMNNNQCVYPRGRVIGGSSTINAMIHTRGNKADYDEWEKLGNPGWSYEDVLPYFKKSEVIDMKTSDINYHGTNGPIHVNITAPPDVTTEYFKKALLEVGVPEVDINGKQQLGMSRVPMTINFNKRSSGYDSYIAPIEKRRNLKIILNAFVIKLLLSKRRAKGVLYVKNGKIFKATVKKELILSAGAVNTPQLLMISGIGPTESLKKLGIDVINDFPAVGKNLQDHPQFSTLLIRTNRTRESATLRKLLEKYLQGETPLTRGLGTELISFFKPTTANSESDIELMTVIPSIASPNQEYLYNLKNTSTSPFNPLTDFIVLLLLLKPKSTGEITLKSKNPSDFPSIDIRFYSDPDDIDMKTMYHGIKFVLNLTQTESLKEINATYEGRQPECEHLLTDDCRLSGYRNECDKSYWYCAIRNYGSVTYHPVSTARMGPDPKNHVVDHNCLVHNYGNFRVVDASVIPKIINGHTNAAVYMIAEKIADSIKIRYQML